MDVSWIPPSTDVTLVTLLMKYICASVDPRYICELPWLLAPYCFKISEQKRELGIEEKSFPRVFFYINQMDELTVVI